MKTGRGMAVSVLIAGLLVLPAMAEKSWETDFEKAGAAAKASHRYMLLDFSGSDWCGWCMKLEEEVFSKREFKEYADQNLVCVLLDFPQRKQLKKHLQEQNTRLAQKYGVRGYPSVIILSPDGEMVAKTGYVAGGAEKYVANLKGLIDPHRKANKVAEPAPVTVATAKQPARSLTPPGPQVKLAKDESREVRTWRTKNGLRIKASLLEEKPPYMVLKKEDGTTTQVSRYNLSDADLQYIAGLRADSAEKPADSTAKP